MKNILFFFVSVFSLAQNPNHQTFLDHNWRLNFVQDGNNTPVYVASSINYPIFFQNQNVQFQYTITVCNWHYFGYNYMDNLNIFNKIESASSLAVCDGPPYPENIMFFDAFVSNFQIFTSPNDQFPFELTTLPNNQYSLDIYNPAGKRLNFNSTGLSANSNEAISFNVFPNPVSDFLNLTFDANIKNLSLYNMKGQLVFETDTHFQQIDMSACHSGVYLLKIVGEDEQVVYKKVVKN